MFETEPLHNRQRILPYVFGGLTGVSIALVIVAAIVMSKGSDEAAVGRTVPQTGSGAVASTNATPSIDTGRRNAIVNATEMVAPAVVNVTVVRTETYRSRFWEDWFSRNWPVQRRKVGSYGSGVIIRPDGYVVTNEHVVANADEIWVTLPDGTDMMAELVGEAANYDLALLKVTVEDLPYVEMGNSDDLMVGEWIIAIGSPFGHLLADTHPTVTVGVVSAFHRDVKPEASNQRILKDLIQTDAAINPGNSGGPLVNSDGEVIGINAAIFSRGGGSEGIGFAIPINRVKWVVDEMLTYGRVRPVYMGMTGIDITPELAAGLDLTNTQGVLVRDIYEDGPAFRAGIRAGDLLISIRNIELRDIQHANQVVFPARVGDKLDIVIDRKGKQKKVTLVLEERPDDI